MNTSKRRRDARLVDRDYDILDHVARYHLTTRDVLHLLYFDDSELNAVTKVTSRLCEFGFLCSHRLYANKNYFVLGPAGARLLGISPKKSKPIGVQALPEKYAILQYCCLSPHDREKLQVRELAAYLGTLQGKGLKAANYYVDQDGTTARLAQMRVDLGGTAAHVVRKCRDDLERLVMLPAIDSLVRKNEFMLAILTTSAQKEKDIQDALLRHSWPIVFRVEAVADLGPLLANQYQRRGSDT